MEPTELFMLVLPIAVLAWSSLGRGVIARGRPQVSLYCILLIAGYWLGPLGAVGGLVLLFMASAKAIGKHVLPETPTYREEDVMLDDFRGESQTVTAKADLLGLEHLVDYRQDIGTAAIGGRVFTDGNGTYVEFSRTTMPTGHADNLWLHSAFDDGVAISSSDELRSIDFAAPFHQIRMRVLDDLPALYRFHREGIDAYGRTPCVLSASAYLERKAQDERRRYVSGCDSGYLRRVNGGYRYTIKASLRTFLHMLNIVGALAPSAVVGGTVPATNQR